MGFTTNPYANFYTGTVTAGGTDGTLVSETYQTTLTASNLADDTVLNVASTTGFVAGMDVVVGSESKTIASISGLQITLSTALAFSHVTGEVVANAGSGTAPMTIQIKGSETAIQTRAVRTRDGYQIESGAIISAQGTGSARWALSVDGTTFAEYGASIIIPDAIGSVNTLYYCKAKPMPGDTPQPDMSVRFELDGFVSAL